MHITRAFLEGMKEVAPQEVHIVDIIDKHIKYCIALTVSPVSGTAESVSITMI